MIKVFIRMIISLSILCCSLAWSAQTLDRVVAVVNDQVITLSQLNQAVAQVKRQAQANNAPLPSDSIVKKKVLDQLIIKDLQLQLAKRNNITATSAQINSAIAEIAAQNHATVAQVYQMAAKQGLSVMQFKQQIRDQLLISQIQKQAVGSTISVTDQEVANFAKQNAHVKSNPIYHVVDVLIPLDANASSAQLQTAEQQVQTLVQNVHGGMNLQQAVSKIPNAQVQDLGWRLSSQLPDVFARNISSMKIGELSQPIRAPNGVHLLQLVAMQGNAPKLTKEQMRNLLFNQKAEAQIEQWLKQVRSQAYVKVML